MILMPMDCSVIVLGGFVFLDGWVCVGVYDSGCLVVVQVMMFRTDDEDVNSECFLSILSTRWHFMDDQSGNST